MKPVLHRLDALMREAPSDQEALAERLLLGIESLLEALALERVNVVYLQTAKRDMQRRLEDEVELGLKRRDPFLEVP